MLIIKVGGGTDINIPGIVNDLAALDDPFIVVLGANALRDSIGERLSIDQTGANFAVWLYQCLF